LKGKTVPYEVYNIYFILQTLDFFDLLGEDPVKVNLKNFEYDTLLRIFKHRAITLVQKSASKLADKVQNKEHVMDAWNNSQTFYIQNLVNSYGEIYILKCFKKINEVIVNKNLKEIMNNLLILFSLSSIEADIGLFRENDFLTSEDFETIKDHILLLCKDLSKHFVNIMDIISPPDYILGSPFASETDDVNTFYITKLELRWIHF
jgi:acyl-CoA oxidase